MADKRVLTFKTGKGMQARLNASEAPGAPELEARPRGFYGAPNVPRDILTEHQASRPRWRFIYMRRKPRAFCMHLLGTVRRSMNYRVAACELCRAPLSSQGHFLSRLTPLPDRSGFFVLAASRTQGVPLGRCTGLKSDGSFQAAFVRPFALVCASSLRMAT